MGRQIYVNLPVADLECSKTFFSRLGFGFNAQFSNDKGACMIVTDDIYVMLLTRDFFQGFTRKPVADAASTTEVLVCLSCGSRAEVDALVTAALEAGGTAPNPRQDHGFMYAHGFEDLDGHVWELVYMAPQADGGN